MAYSLSGIQETEEKTMTQILGNFADLTVQMVIMWIIGAVMIYLAIKKEM